MSLGTNTPGNRTKAMQSSTFLSRLGRDQKGNALAIVAASIIPLVGAIGGGVDLTRAYMAEARLAQACDAAALAGRKVLVNSDLDGDNVKWDSKSGQEIQRFLDYNFPAGKFGSGTIAKTASVDDEGALTITLATAIDTSLLRIASIDSIPIDASCSSRRSGVNVDVVMVLDVTGSMAYDINKSSGDKNERLIALQGASLNFLDTLDDLREQLASSGTRVRVGIVPYSQSVNVGYDLLAEDESYINTTVTKYYSTVLLPRKSGTKWYNKTASGNNQPATGNITLDLSGYVNRGKGGYTNPYSWKGCIEMRPTVQTITASTSLDSIPSGAWDISDVEPGVGGAPKWQPYINLPHASEADGKYGAPTSGPATSDDTFKKIVVDADRYTRVPYNITDNQTGPTLANTQATSLVPKGAGPNNGCNDRVKLLSESTRADLESYINNLTIEGATYHDIGMYWGLALISPQAPFQNASTYLAPGFTGQARGVNRYIVFMTDGKMEPTSHYSAWGREDNPSAAGNQTIAAGNTNRINTHRRRFRMICEEAKRTGVEVYTVAFATGVTTDDETALKKCATTETDHYFKASSASALDTAFLKIAQNIGYLRLSK